MNTTAYRTKFQNLICGEGVPRIKIANAPCSWGVLEFELEGEAADYRQVLNEIVETGYQGVGA